MRLRALVEKGSKSTVRYIFTDGFGYAIFSGGFLRKPPLEIVFLEAVAYEKRIRNP
jgi:hypothetical protein